jgi:UV DNA damage endonuclease
MSKIGFCCKYNPPDINDYSKYNTKTTTVSWLKNNTDQVYEKLNLIVKHNLQSQYLLLQEVSKLPTMQHMVRISSDILPMFTHEIAKEFYSDSTISSFIETELHNIGKFAIDNNIRISMHPGQFCVLASENPNIVNNSILELEYHAYLLYHMGFCRKFQDAKCNIHISGKNGYKGMRQVHTQLSPEIRNVITIENDEITHGLDQCMNLIDLYPIVIDIHHHFIKTGEYLNISNDYVTKALESWKGIRPIIHLSQSKEDILSWHGNETLPDLNSLLAKGYNKRDLRAHSQCMWNNAINRWSHQFLESFDIMIEAKSKNLASTQYVNYLNEVRG